MKASDRVRRSELFFGVLVLTVSLCAVQSPADPSLILHLKFDETSGTTAYDSSGYGNDGTLQYMQPTDWVTGRINGGVQFDGGNKTVKVWNSPTLSTVGANNADFTVAFWIRLEQGPIGNWRVVIRKGNADTQRTFGIWSAPSENRLHFAVSTNANWNTYGNAVTPLQLGQWTHVVQMKAGNQSRLYLNGTLNSSFTLTSPVVANSGTLHIGDDPWWPGTKMTLDDLRIYTRALSTQEVAQLAIAQQAPSAQAGPDVTIHWADQASTVLYGQAFDPNNDPLIYRWLESGTVLLDWTPVGYAGEANLLLGTLPAFSLGTHVLALEVDDGYAVTADTMTLTLTNGPPVCDAGENLQISTEEQADTTLCGTVSDPDQEPVQYRWLISGVAVTGWQPVPSEGEVCLSLATVSALAPGEHLVTLEATDGVEQGSDTMLLSVENSQPRAVTNGCGTYELGVDVVLLGGTVSDFDGDLLTYAWIEGDTVLVEGSIQAVPGGAPVTLPLHQVHLALGSHPLALVVRDGVCPAVIADCLVVMIDTTAPTLVPIASPAILWPPNHQLVPVQVVANAYDNGGGAVFLSANVISSQPANGTGDGNTQPDIVVRAIDQEDGVIDLLLRSERAGKGQGRTYTITVVATDEAGNQSAAQVLVVAPHDKSKK